MSDTTLNRFIASGTTADRTAFTPNPATPASGPSAECLWWDTDLQALYAYNFGTAAWVAVASAGTGTVTHTGSLTAHAIVLGNGSADVKPLASLGTNTTVLHGAAAGDPSFSAIDLAADVTGNLGVAHLNAGASAGSTTFWRGDATWASPIIAKRVTTAADAASITPNTDTADITYQANTQTAGTLTINADGGSPSNGQSWVLKIKSTNVQTFSWNGVYVGGAIALPVATTGSSKIDNFAFFYDTVNSKWEFTGSAQGF